MRAYFALVVLAFVSSCTGSCVGSCADRHLAAAARESIRRPARAPAPTSAQLDDLGARILAGREREAFRRGLVAGVAPAAAWGGR
jgi:hypothetical protein